MTLPSAMLELAAWVFLFPEGCVTSEALQSQNNEWVCNSVHIPGGDLARSRAYIKRQRSGTRSPFCKTNHA